MDAETTNHPTHPGDAHYDQRFPLPPAALRDEVERLKSERVALVAAGIEAAAEYVDTETLGQLAANIRALKSRAAEIAEESE